MKTTTITRSVATVASTVFMSLVLAAGAHAGVASSGHSTSANQRPSVEIIWYKEGSDEPGTRLPGSNWVIRVADNPSMAWGAVDKVSYKHYSSEMEGDFPVIEDRNVDPGEFEIPLNESYFCPDSDDKECIEDLKTNGIDLELVEVKAPRGYAKLDKPVTFTYKVASNPRDRRINLGTLVNDPAPIPTVTVTTTPPPKTVTNTPVTTTVEKNMPPVTTTVEKNMPPVTTTVEKNMPPVTDTATVTTEVEKPTTVTETLVPDNTPEKNPVQEIPTATTVTVTETPAPVTINPDPVVETVPETAPASTDTPASVETSTVEEDVQETSSVPTSTQPRTEGKTQLASTGVSLGAGVLGAGVLVSIAGAVLLSARSRRK